MLSCSPVSLWINCRKTNKHIADLQLIGISFNQLISQIESTFIFLKTSQSRIILCIERMLVRVIIICWYVWWSSNAGGGVSRITRMIKRLILSGLNKEKMMSSNQSRVCLNHREWWWCFNRKLITVVVHRLKLSILQDPSPIIVIVLPVMQCSSSKVTYYLVLLWTPYSAANLVKAQVMKVAFRYPRNNQDSKVHSFNNRIAVRWFFKRILYNWESCAHNRTSMYSTVP